MLIEIPVRGIGNTVDEAVADAYNQGIEQGATHVRGGRFYTECERGTAYVNGDHSMRDCWTATGVMSKQVEFQVNRNTDKFEVR